MIRLKKKMKKRRRQSKNLRGRGKWRETERRAERTVIAGRGPH